MRFLDSDGSDNHEIPISNGILKPPHVRQIGPAFALFLKLEDMVTEGDGQDGLVYGGRPVRDEELADALGLPRRTVQGHRSRLASYGYISTKKRENGFVIRVRKSRKWEVIQHPKKRAGSGEISPRPGQNPPEAGENPPSSGQISPGIGRQHQGLHQGQQQQTGTPAAAPFKNLDAWRAIGSDLPMGDPRFQAAWSFYYRARNGTPLSEAMERCIQARQRKGRKVPPPFYDAKRRVELQERPDIASPDEEEIPFVEPYR